MKEYLSSDYRQFEENPFVRDRIIEAFESVGKHVAKLESRINLLEKEQLSHRPKARGR